jgi:hypothetical protein
MSDAHETCNATQTQIDQCNANDNKHWEEHECLCQCNATECPHNRVLNESTCLCECGSPANYNCHDGQIVIDNEGHTCMCGCPEGQEDTCNNIDGTSWNNTNCECECSQNSTCATGAITKLEGGECKCVCDATALHCDSSHVAILDTEQGKCKCACDPAAASACTGDTNFWNDHDCICETCSQLSGGVSVGDTSCSVADESAFDGATSATFEPGTDRTETLEFDGVWVIGGPGSNEKSLIENTESKTSSWKRSAGGLTFKDGQQFQYNHPDGSTIVPGFPATSQSDPHIKTFFDDSYQL